MIKMFFDQEASLLPTYFLTLGILYHALAIRRWRMVKLNSFSNNISRGEQMQLISKKDRFEPLDLNPEWRKIAFQFQPFLVVKKQSLFNLLFNFSSVLGSLINFYKSLIK